MYNVWQKKLFLDLRRLKENALSEYSKGWAKGMYDQLKRSITDTEVGPVRSEGPGPDS